MFGRQKLIGDRRAFGFPFAISTTIAGDQWPLAIAATTLLIWASSSSLRFLIRSSWPSMLASSFAGCVSIVQLCNR